MKRKNHLILFFIVAIICTIGVYSCDKHSKENIDISNKYLFKDNQHGLSVWEYKEILSELKQSFSIEDDKQFERDLIQYFVNLYILSDIGIEKGYEHDPELIKELNEFGNTNLIEKAKLHLLKEYAPNKKEIRRCYKRSHRQVNIDYIYFNKNQSDLYKATLEEAMAGNEFSRIKLESLQEGTYDSFFFDSKKLTGGSLINKVEKTAYKMVPGEIKGIKTNNGYYILFVNKVFNRNGMEPEYEKQRIKEDLTMAKAVSSTGSINNLLFNEQIDVRQNNISAINFSFTALNENGNNKSSIIAKAWNNEVTTEELTKLIKPLPKEIQYYFFNEDTKLQAIIRLLVYKYGSLNENNEVLQNIEIKKRELVQLYLESILKNDIITDQKKEIDINNIDETMTKKSLSKLLSNFDNDSTKQYKEVLINEALKYYKYNPELQNSLVLSSFNWSNTVTNFEPQNLLIDINQVKNFKFPNPYSFRNDQIIAIFNNKTLKVADYLNELNKLSIETINSLIKENNAIQFIHIIMDEANKNRGTINRELLEQVNSYMKMQCLLLDIKKQIIIGDTTTIAFANNYQYQLKDIKNIFYAYPVWKKKKYLERDINADIIKQLIENKHWLDYALKNNLENEIKFKEKYDLARRFLLAQKVYMKNIYCKPLRIPGEKINNIVMSVFKEIETRNLEKQMNEYLKNHEFKVSSETFHQLGYNYDSILNCNYNNSITHRLIKINNTGFVSPVPYYLSTFSDSKLWYIGDYEVNGLAAYWSFNEGTGKYCYDYSGNGYYGKIINNASFTKEKHNNNISIDKCDAVLVGKNNFSLNSKFTITCWVNVSSQGAIFFKSSGKDLSDYIWKFNIARAEKNLAAYLNLLFKDRDEFLLGGTKIQANKWTFLSATYDSEYMKLYEDGIKIAEVRKTGEFLKNKDAVTIIGNYPHLTNYSAYFDDFFEGFIDELTVYNRELNSSEIKRLFKSEQKNYK